MIISSKAVANYFIEQALDTPDGVSPMKVQKLVYYAHGWHLGINGQPLIDEQVECWPHGPVVDSLFHEFKEYGRERITRFATRWVTTEGEDFLEGLRQITPSISDYPAVDYRSYLASIWEAYGGYSATKLSNMTHEEGGPWHRVFMAHNGQPPKGTDIPREYIQEYFSDLYQSNVVA